MRDFILHTPAFGLFHRSLHVFIFARSLLAALQAAGLKYAIIPGGLTMFIQAIDGALAALYKAEHHSFYMTSVENKYEVTL